MSFFEIGPLARTNPESVDDSTSPPPDDPDERPSFGTLYRRYYRKVRASVRRFGVPERDVEDVTQSVFLAVYQSLPRFDWSRSPKPWLSTIAYRVARDHLRAGKNGKELLSVAEEFDPPDPASAEGEWGMGARRDMLGELDAVLQCLDEEDRELLLLCDVDELRQSDVAEALGLPLGTVATRLRRARRRFEEALHRRRVAEARRLGGDHLIPLFLLDPAALLEAGRALPRVSLAAQARLWGRLVRATATCRTTRALASVVGLSPAKLVGLVSLTTLLGGLGGGALVHLAWLRAVGPEAARTGGQARAVTAAETPEPPSVIEGAVAPPAILATPIASLPGPGVAARPEHDRAAAERAEMALLDSARNALRNHHPEAALAELDRHAREFPRGTYGEERESLRREARRMLPTLTPSPDP